MIISDPNAENSPRLVRVSLSIAHHDPLSVPSEYSIIQDAIDAAVTGEIITVAPGTYTGDGNRDLNFYGKAITLRSIDPNDPNVVAATVIDCNGSKDDPHRGFYFHSGEGPGSIIFGFTIRNGYICGDANDPNVYGGAIFCNGSSPTIKNCIITNSKLQAKEGTLDSAADGGNAYGGGIYCTASSNPAVINCTISFNSAVSGSADFEHPESNADLGNACGGGLYCDSNSNPRINNCIFYFNKTISSLSFSGHKQDYYGYNSKGGAVYLESSSPLIENCTITQNFAIGFDSISQYNSPDGGDAYGGAIYCTLNSNPIISSCTISYNEAKGGLGSNPMLQNCNIIGNTVSGGNGGRGHYCPATDAGDVYGAGICCDSDSTMTIYYCNINNNQATGGIGGTGEHDVPGKSGDARGGGIYAGPKSDLAFRDCHITGNTALGGKGGRSEEGYTIGGTGGSGYGGGICWDFNSVSMVENCLISGNLTAGGSGGDAWGFYVATGGNGGDGYAGGIYCPAESKTTILNCTISANRAFAGEGGIGDTVEWWTVENGAIGNAYGAGIYYERNSIGIIANCIIWDNLGAEQIEGSNPNVSFSDVQGGYQGQRNIDSDPLFVRLGYWADMNDLDAMLAPNHPNAVWVMGDYHLSQPAAGQQVASPCVDAGSDLAGNLSLAELTTRTDGASDTEIVDMGYHYDRPSLADADGDGNTDLTDYAFLGGHWQENVEPKGHREHVGEYRSRLALREIPIGSAVIDGYVSEWLPMSCPYLDLDKAYYGEAADVHSAVYLIRLDPDSGKIYLIVHVEDEDHVLSNDYIRWDASDRIEVYVQAVPEGGTDFLGKYDIAQQYMIGPKPAGGYWATWALGEQIGEDVDFECVVRRYGESITYEVAVPLFDYYGGFTGQETVRAHLEPASIIGFDVVVSSRSADGFGMLSENLMTGKSQDAGQFAKYILGPVKLYMPNAGYRADFNYDGFVDWLDLALLAEQWRWHQSQSAGEN
jgi:hypothetical protein